MEEKREVEEKLGARECEHSKRWFDCRICRPCDVCPCDDDHGSAANPKHLDTDKHRFNWRIYQMFWTNSAGKAIVDVNERHMYVVTMMTDADQKNDRFARIDDHKPNRPDNAITIEELEGLINKS